jgi:hypothetical protein
MLWFEEVVRLNLVERVLTTSILKQSAFSSAVSICLSLVLSSISWRGRFRLISGVAEAANNPKIEMLS